TTSGRDYARLYAFATGSACALCASPLGVCGDVPARRRKICRWFGTNRCAAFGVRRVGGNDIPDRSTLCRQALGLSAYLEKQHRRGERSRLSPGVFSRCFDIICAPEPARGRVGFVVEPG